MDTNKLIKKDIYGTITEINNFKIHPYANIVTIDPNIDTLADSIKRTGLRHPIVTYKNQVLDGRRRILACASLGIEPASHDLGIDRELTEKELYEIVLAENNRRNLSATQRAIIAARETLVGRHKNTPYTVASIYAKQIWNVSEPTLKMAKTLVKQYPHFASELFDGGSVEIAGKNYRGVSGLLTALRGLERQSADTDPNSIMAEWKFHISKSIDYGYSKGLDINQMYTGFKSILDKSK